RAVGRQADHRLQAPSTRARRHRLRTSGPRDFRAPDRGRKPADGPVSLPRVRSKGSTGVHLRAVPGAAADEATSRR
nr:hypothetical protein [Tanacetum cinerariifolium]